MDDKKLLTIQQAADILNVFEEHVTSLLEDGKMRYVLVDGQRRIEEAEFMAYKRLRDERRAEALAELARMMDEGLI